MGGVWEGECLINMPAMVSFPWTWVLPSGRKKAGPAPPIGLGGSYSLTQPVPHPLYICPQVYMSLSTPSPFLCSSTHSHTPHTFDYTRFFLPLDGFPCPVPTCPWQFPLPPRTFPPQRCGFCLFLPGQTFLPPGWQAFPVSFPLMWILAQVCCWFYGSGPRQTSMDWALDHSPLPDA